MQGAFCVTLVWIVHPRTARAAYDVEGCLITVRATAYYLRLQCSFAVLIIRGGAYPSVGAPVDYRRMPAQEAVAGVEGGG
eukprot:497930-Alexandrium_andersonii.AAC.1